MLKYTVKVYPNGDKFWYLNDKLHREDGPAVEWANGDKYWYLNGKRHREDGPAVEQANGDKYWYLNGVNLTEEEYRKSTQTPSCEGREVVVDGVTYVLKAKG
jgi:hypothetical protein